MIPLLLALAAHATPEVRVVVVLHLDPGRASADLGTLAGVLSDATADGHVVTVAWGPEWVAWVDDPACTLPTGQACPSWLTGALAGHAEAVHHHALYGPTVWDGYTDARTWTRDADGDGTDESYARTLALGGTDPAYMGTLADLLTDLGDAAAPLSWAGTTEMPATARYAVVGGTTPYVDPTAPGSLVGVPCVATTASGAEVWQVTARGVSVADVSAVRSEVALALGDAASSLGEGPVVLAVQWHPDPADVPRASAAALLDDLAAAGAYAVGLEEALGDYGDPVTGAGRPECP